MVKRKTRSESLYVSITSTFEENGHYLFRNSNIYQRKKERKEKKDKNLEEFSTS